MKDKIYLAATFMVNIISLYMIFIWSPPLVVGNQVSADPNIFRIFYIHFPAAIVTYTAFTLTFVGSILYLWKKDFKWDTIAAVSATLGLVFCAITLMAGSIWAENAWGAYWNWDPRETTTLLLFLAYAAYLAYRMAIVDLERRAKLSSVLVVIAFICVPLSYASVYFWRTLHPVVITLTGVSMGATAAETLLVSILGQMLIFFYLLYFTVKTEKLTEKIEFLKARGES
ncbi:MAG TPA: cytochrome c biogenesis protein CcsA [archaeon]|nr:cytochrome c biogenesis protein CcsA [archaeon]